ncbi:MAG TPA: TIGR01459 family HAD-type hydrolase, partial [Methylomirabilota bacterium]|nr:TIGR01459 family HAD-type hydrolase [Methylomirabilota bacterium]
MIFEELTDLAALAERHDVFLVDQFGVLHDGVAPYPGAVEALAALKAAGKRVVLLSNSGRRASVNEERLVGLGFLPGTWDLFLTSGEVAWRRLSGGLGEPAVRPGTRCLLIARGGDRSAVDGLDLTLVDDGRDAEIVLLSGSDGDTVPLERYRALLEPAAAAGAPCLCTNPDKIMLTPVGPRFGAGAIADLYAELGGAVTWIGKPYPEIYRVALDAMGNPAPDRAVAIGDSIEHDIAGAKGVGIAASLVRSGILADLSPGELRALCRHHGAEPDTV